MPRFTFKGFSQGSSVAISAVQGAQNASNSVAAWGGDMGTVDILPSTQFAVTAPAPVWLEARNPSGFNVTETLSGYDESFHDITYIWTVRGSQPEKYPQVQNMVSAWNNANVAYGKKVALRFPSAGTYDIDLWCIDSEGATATATTRVIVVAPSFSSANTIVYSESGFSGAPAGTQVSNMAALNSALSGRSNPTRLTFKPGESINSVAIRPTSGNLAYIDTWSEGSKVTLNNRFIDRFTRTGFEYDDEFPGSQITIRDIIFQSGWDPTTETGDYANGVLRWAPCPNRLDIMIYNCDFNGQEAVDVTMGDTTVGNRILISDCAWDGWRGFGIQSFQFQNSQDYYSVIGCRVAQNPLALAGGPKTGMQNDHGCFRISDAKHIYLACNDFFTTSGWSGNPPDANAALRLHTSVRENASTIIERNVIEGGYVKVKIDGQNGSQTEYPGNHLIERNLCIGTARTNLFFRAHYGGTTIRNNLCYMPDAPIFGGNIFEFYEINPEAPDATNNEPFSIYNNSFVSRETAGNRALTIGSTSYWNIYTNENNIFYTPGNSPLDFATVFETDPGTNLVPRYSQVHFNFQVYVTNLGVSVPNGGTVSIPYSALDRSTGFGHSSFNTGSTAATNQAYWQGVEASGDNLHMMRVNTVNFGLAVLFASRGDFSVSYSNPTNIVITNTSGSTWNTGEWAVRLDRKSLLATDLPADTSYANPSVVPQCRLLSAPGPQDTSGRLAYDDLFGTKREQPVATGAIEA